MFIHVTVIDSRQRYIVFLFLTRRALEARIQFSPVQFRDTSVADFGLIGTYPFRALVNRISFMSLVILK